MTKYINSPDEPVNTGTGRQYFGEEAKRKAAKVLRSTSSRTGRGGNATTHTTIIGGTGPVNTGSGAQHNVQRGDTWVTYTEDDDRRPRTS